MEFGWVIGVALGLVASFLSTLGMLLQKRSNYAVDATAQGPWAVGLSCMTVGALGDFAAFGFAAQFLLAPLGGSTIVVRKRG